MYSPPAALTCDTRRNRRVFEPNLAKQPDARADYAGYHLFSGQGGDIIDNSSLKTQSDAERFVQNSESVIFLVEDEL